MRRLHASPVLNTVYPSRVHPHRENVRKLRSLRSAVSLSRVPSFLLLFPFFLTRVEDRTKKWKKPRFTFDADLVSMLVSRFPRLFMINSSPTFFTTIGILFYRFIIQCLSRNLVEVMLKKKRKKTFIIKIVSKIRWPAVVEHASFGQSRITRLYFVQERSCYLIISLETYLTSGARQT